MLNSKLVKEAHRMTREIKSQYSDVDYKFQFGLCLSYLLNESEEVEMVELKGSEKQIKWATTIREILNKTADKMLEMAAELKEEIAKGPKSTANYEYSLNLIKEIKNFAENEESAAKFIDEYKNLNTDVMQNAWFIASDLEGKSKGHLMSDLRYVAIHNRY